MKKRSLRKSELRVESLEKREVLSGGHLGPAAELAHHHSVPLIGVVVVTKPLTANGVGTPVLTVALNDGSLQLFSRGFGTSNVIGPYAGPISANLTPPTGRFVAFASFTDPFNEGLQFAMGGSARPAGLNSISHIHGKFGIAGGAGILTSAFGGGVFNGTFNTSDGVLTLKLNGRVSV
jgi:hypothetical protein